MKYLTVLLCFIAYCNFTFAQNANPVRWTFRANKINDAEYNLVFTASIQNGWCIFSQYLEEGGAWPTSLNFDLSPDYELIDLTQESGKKKEGYDPMFGVNIIKYEGRMTLSQKVRIKESLQEISGYIEFMSCNTEGCLPFTNVDFAFSFLE